MLKLVIVESSAKAKTIKKYLGSGYEAVVSMGYVRDLQENCLSMDTKNDFKSKCEIIKGKKKLVQELKSAVEKGGSVLPATDPDREGKVIPQHLAYILDFDTTLQNRITFNEITKTSITNRTEHPRLIDLDLANAQQARRILDRLVGRKLSPLLSQKIRCGLSVGRVQSVVVRLVVDREEEIRAFVPEEHWSIDAELIPKGERKVSAAVFYGDASGKIKITNQRQVDETLKSLENAEFPVSEMKKGSRRKFPAPLFITSILQQEVSRKPGFQARRTMKAVQELYEGIEIGGMGIIGLITYMRTDLLCISEDVIHDVMAYIEERRDKKYLPDAPRHLKTKANAQDGHEAIRPPIPSITSEQVKNSLINDQYRLYKLIWECFIACQMANHPQNTTQVGITAGEYLFKASGCTIMLDGFTVLYEEGKDEETEQGSVLPVLAQDMPLKKKELVGSQYFIQPPPRYTEAPLIKALEENGIGRPSIYTATISTTTSREYVMRSGKALHLTELREATTQLMCERSPKIVNVKFTAQVEKDLDTVQSGETGWVQTLHNFYGNFEKTLERVKEDMEGVKIRLKEGKADVICERCGRHMVVKVGRHGKFLACPGHPECKNIKKLVVGNGAERPECGSKVVVKKTKKGRVSYGCSEYPRCDFVSWDEPTMEKCPRCGKTLLHKKGKTPKLHYVAPGCGYKKMEEQ